MSMFGYPQHFPGYH